MFGKLKEKLKSALSIFSRKAEEEADVKQIEVEKEVPIVEKAVSVVKKVEPVSAKKVGKKEEKKTVAKKEEKIEKKEDKTVGKKSVLIFHGWEDTAESGFIPRLKQDLRESGYDALSFDQPNTDKPKFEKWFSFAEKKIARANKHDLCIVGHSMGGLLSLKLAEKYKLKKLILVAPVGAKPSADYFKLFEKKLKPQELEIFKAYQNRNLDIAKIKRNVQEIVFIFGLQDPWITQEIRDFYITSFKDVAEIHVFETYGHMMESEGVKELPILKELFARDLNIGVVEHRGEQKLAQHSVKEKVHFDEKKLAPVVSTAPVKKNLLAQQMEHFAKLKEQQTQKETVTKKEDLKTINVVEKEKVLEKRKVVEEKVTSVIDSDEVEEVDEDGEEFSVSSSKNTKEEKIILPVEDESVNVVGEKEEKEESNGFFGKLKKTFTFKKEKQKVEENVSENVNEEVEDVKDVLEVKNEKKGIFGKIKEKVTSRTISGEKFEELFWDLELALLENNVSVEVIEKIKVDLKQELVNKPLPWDVLEKIHKTLTRTLTEILSFESQELGERIEAKKKKPYVIAFFGINGTGKTTSIAKLTYHLQERGYSVVLAACDTFRAAAIQQLGVHAQKLNVKMIQHNYGSDAAAVAFDAVQYAEKNKIDVVLIDTAGRLHSNTNLMAELQKIIRVVKPDLKIFVGESITGNDCIEQARQFNSLVEMDGAILTKVDVDEKGGAPLSIAYTIKKPILFLGVGQEYKDLEKFEAETILGRLGL